MQQLALFVIPSADEEGGGGESVGAQPSIPDEENSGESMASSIGQDQGFSDLDPVPDSNPGSVDDDFRPSEVIPDMQNETWGYLKTPKERDNGGAGVWMKAVEFLCKELKRVVLHRMGSG